MGLRGSLEWPCLDCYHSERREKRTGRVYIHCMFWKIEWLTREDDCSVLSFLLLVYYQREALVIYKSVIYGGVSKFNLDSRSSIGMKIYTGLHNGVSVRVDKGMLMVELRYILSAVPR
mgnify:CR=1 FL=1